MKLFSLPAVVLLLLAGSTRATTIVAVRTPTEIVIGADSKVTDTFGNLAGEACKIQQAGNLFFAVEGMIRDRRTGFDVLSIARRALLSRPQASAAEKVSILTGSVTSQLFAELPILKQQDPATYREKVEGGQVFLSILIAGFEGNQPLLFIRRFRAVPVNRNTIGVTVLPDDCAQGCSPSITVKALGETAAIEGLAEETQGFWSDGIVSGVRRLIETEIAARSEYVGPPIDILRIDRRGARWIQQKPACRRSAGR